MVIYATTVGGWRRRSDPIAQGKQVRKNESLIVLPDTSQMVASVKVHESLVGQLKIGQKAMITIDATPGAPIQGEVCEIGVMATNGGWMNPDLREYTVKLNLPPTSGEDLKPAMRCSSRIITGRVENVLFVPIQCVVTVGKQSYVYVRDGEKSIRTKVTAGKSNESIVAINEGLEEGQRVMMVPPAQVEQTGKGKGKPGEGPDQEGKPEAGHKPDAGHKPEAAGDQPKADDHPKPEEGDAKAKPDAQAHQKPEKPSP
jgi:hypothetical protein